MRPNELDEKSVTGTPRFTRLKMLNPSTRISTALVSPNGTRLMNDRSALIIPGPRTELRGALPDWPAGAFWNAAVLNHCAAVFAPAFGSATRFGRQLGVQFAKDLLRLGHHVVDLLEWPQGWTIHRVYCEVPGAQLFQPKFFPSLRLQLAV